MPRLLWSGGVTAALVVMAAACAGERTVLNFNPDWRFVRDDPAGASAIAFDDAAWTPVSTPHTYNDADTFDDWSLSAHRGEQNQWAGRTWYRKTFSLPASAKGRKVFIEFEAARQVAKVYLNGRRLGVSKTGFTPFGFDLTPHLRFDGPNVLAVMCDNRFVRDPEPAPRAPGGKSVATGNLHANLETVNRDVPENIADLQADQIPWNNPHWHPAHGGIYRNVRLYITDPLHIMLPLYSFLETVGPYVYATDISRDAAQVHVEIPVRNERATDEVVEARATIIDAYGRTALVLQGRQPIAAGAATTFVLSGTLFAPLPWEPQFPHLYRVGCAVAAREQVVDTCEVPLGIRVARWTADQGLFLNGRHYKLHGWGQKPTDEWPGLGAAQPDWMHAFTLEMMRAAGGNFVRWGHCAGGPASIAAGDRLGLIADQPGVDGESDTRAAAWQLRAAAFRDVIVYYRNHPSILIWEGGNQKVSREHAAELRGIMDQFDPHGGRAYAHRRADEVTAEFMDVGIGTEGGREIARLPVVEGEYDREESPRRVWDDFSPPNFGYPEAAGQTYQLTSEQYAVNQIGPQWIRKLAAPDHGGGANWIFSDSTSGGRVATEVARAGGEVDGVRLPKEAYHVCAVMFLADAPVGDASPQIHIVGHWTYPPDTRKTIHVASNAAEVELLVNGRSLGRVRSMDRFLFTFPDVAWEPGTIIAVGYDADGHPVATQSKRTAGAPVALRLTRAHGSRRAVGGRQRCGPDRRRSGRCHGRTVSDVPAAGRFHAGGPRHLARRLQQRQGRLDQPSVPRSRMRHQPRRDPGYAESGPDHRARDHAGPGGWSDRDQGARVGGGAWRFRDHAGVDRRAAFHAGGRTSLRRGRRGRDGERTDGDGAPRGPVCSHDVLHGAFGPDRPRRDAGAGRPQRLCRHRFAVRRPARDAAGSGLDSGRQPRQRLQCGRSDRDRRAGGRDNVRRAR